MEGCSRYDRRGAQGLQGDTLAHAGRLISVTSAEAPALIAAATAMVAGVNWPDAASEAVRTPTKVATAATVKMMSGRFISFLLTLNAACRGKIREPRRANVRLHDTATMEVTMQTKLTLEERFWSKVDRSEYGPGGCWPWIGHRLPAGYGTLGNEYSHRLAVKISGRVIPDRYSVDHVICQNPPCCNFAHLEPVPHWENTRRGNGWTAQSARKTECKRGHAFDEANTYVNRKGHRYCRKCKALHQRDYNHLALQTTR